MSKLALHLQRIEYWINWLAQGFSSGTWASVFRGRGFDFQDIIPYQEYPDFTLINWPASLIEEELQVTIYAEEKTIDLYLIGNLCPSMAFGSEQTKIERLALLAALFSYAAYWKKDRFRFIGYTNEAELGFPSPRDKSDSLRLAEAILGFDWRRKKRGGLLKAVARIPPQRSLVVIASDFFGLGSSVEAALTRLTPHDVVPIVLWDKREIELPPGRGILPLRELETGKLNYVLLTQRTREAHRRNVEEQRSKIQTTFRRFGREPFFFTEEESDLEALVRIFLQRRERF